MDVVSVLDKIAIVSEIAKLGGNSNIHGLVSNLKSRTVNFHRLDDVDIRAFLDASKLGLIGCGVVVVGMDVVSVLDKVTIISKITKLGGNSNINSLVRDLGCGTINGNCLNNVNVRASINSSQLSLFGISVVVVGMLISGILNKVTIIVKIGKLSRKLGLLSIASLNLGVVIN